MVALIGQPGDGPLEQGDAVGLVLHAGELAVSQPQVGVDRSVGVGVAQSSPVVRDGAAQLLVTAAVGDWRQLS